jgi:polyhydroxyalkanoate synthesis regulator phasin
MFGHKMTVKRTDRSREVTMTFFETVRKALLAGFGMQDRVKELVDELVEKGELSKSQGAKLVREWSQRAEKSTVDVSQSLSDIINKILQKMNVPTKDEVAKLNRKLQNISTRIKRLEESLQDKIKED